MIDVFTHHVSRITFHASRFTHHVSRITFHSSFLIHHSSFNHFIIHHSSHFTPRFTNPAKFVTISKDAKPSLITTFDQVETERGKSNGRCDSREVQRPFRKESIRESGDR